MRKSLSFMHTRKAVDINGCLSIISKRKELMIIAYPLSTYKYDLGKQKSILNKDIYSVENNLQSLAYFDKKSIFLTKILEKGSLKIYDEDNKNVKQKLEALDIYNDNEFMKNSKNEGVLSITNNKQNRDIIDDNINLNSQILKKTIEKLNKNNNKTNINNTFSYYFNNYLDLSKSKLTLWVTLSSTFGYFMLGGSSLAELSALSFGVYLCSSSANTFNQIRERDIDKIMKRTQKRPLASNQISLPHSELFGFTTAITGSLVLYFFNNPLTAYMGIFNILLYTCVYTPLKLKTPYNTHIGSIVGSIPTLMGCTAVNQNLLLPEPWILFVTQLLWQFPHFYSLAYLYKKDYIKGNYKMFPLKDTNGTYTAKLCRPYVIALSSLPLIFFFCGYTSYMYMLTSLIPNMFIYYKFRNFSSNPSKSNIRSFFKHSLWHIILLLALSAYHTQVPYKSDNNGNGGNSTEENKNDLDKSSDHNITKFKKKLLKFCVIFS